MGRIEPGPPSLGVEKAEKGLILVKAQVQPRWTA